MPPLIRVYLSLSRDSSAFPRHLARCKRNTHVAVRTKDDAKSVSFGPKDGYAYTAGYRCRLEVALGFSET